MGLGHVPATAGSRTRSGEAVGTRRSMPRAIGDTRPGGYVGCVGVSAYRALDERRAVKALPRV
ncbi:hypothetical protein GCM10027072_12880 [Streptomyces bullii]